MFIDEFADDNIFTNQVLGDRVSCKTNFASDATASAIGSGRSSEHRPQIYSDAASVHATKPRKNGVKYFRTFLHSVIGVAKVRQNIPSQRFVPNSGIELLHKRVRDILTIHPIEVAAF